MRIPYEQNNRFAFAFKFPCIKYGYRHRMWKCERGSPNILVNTAESLLRFDLTVLHINDVRTASRILIQSVSNLHNSMLTSVHVLDWRERHLCVLTGPPRFGSSAFTLSICSSSLEQSNKIRLQIFVVCYQFAACLFSMFFAIAAVYTRYIYKIQIHCRPPPTQLRLILQQ